ncbi:MAG: hypothetical protein DA408_01325 [Bacteroidetes bacterium]|nr:MAG: hypothetical protein C7N36_00590 [Bacteroidota bacterium]PTM14962.1 MAG: hypothetical protein DA408_01325 [Bacteroidota bacterium]
MLKNTTADKVDLIAELRPETELEHHLLVQAPVQEGMHWGVPRYGHPEGEVYKHVKEVLDNINQLDTTPAQRESLRLIALIHDTFKFQEDKEHPRNWHRHHAVLARRYMEQFTDDHLLLNLIQYHDEAYYIWRDTVVYKKDTQAALRMERLLQRIEGRSQLYYLFFKCDSLTGDKNPAPIRWVEANFPDISPVVL